MAFTKIRGPAGITTTDNYRVGVITATKFVGPFDGVTIGGDGINVSGIVTATGLDINGNADISGNLTVHGDSTTLNTTLREVELLHVDANASVTAGIITQRGSGDILNLFDTTTEVMAVVDGGSVNIGTGELTQTSRKFNVYGGAARVTQTAGGNTIEAFGHTASGSSYGLLVNAGSTSADYAAEFRNKDATTLLRIRGDGKIGIGVASPESLLHVSNTSGNEEITLTSSGMPRLMLKTTGTTAECRLDFGDSGDSSRGAIGYNHSDDALKFYTTGVANERVRINNDGKVGINTTSPSYMLQVQTDGTSTTAGGNIVARFQSSGASGRDATIQLSDNVAHSATISMLSSALIFKQAGAETFRITSSGLVGINKSSPEGRLHIFSATAGSVGTIDGGSDDLIIENSTSAGIAFKVPNSERSTITFATPGTGGATEAWIQYAHESVSTTADRRCMMFRLGKAERLRIDSDGNLIIKDNAAQGNSLVNYIKATDSSGNIQYQYGMLSNGNQDLYIENTKNANIRIRTSGSTRWKIDGNPGHLLPEVANTIDIGSTSNELRNLYIGNSGRAYFGSTQTLSIHNDGSDSFITDSSSAMFVRSNRFLFQNSAGNKGYGEFTNGGSVYFTHDNTKRIETSATGIEVTGEVAASLDYPAMRPILDWNFAASKKLDSRIQFMRDGVGSYVDSKGIIRYAGSNSPRFDHHPTTGESLGLLLEEEKTNLVTNSTLISNANSSNVSITDNNAVSPDGRVNASKIVGSGSDSNTNIYWGSNTVPNNQFTAWSIFVKSEETSCILQFYTNTYVGGQARVNVELADGTTGGDAVSSTWRWSVTKYPNKWWRVTWGGNGANAAGNMRINVVPSKTSARDATSGSAVNKTYYAWGVQEEVGTRCKLASSYIPTYGATAKRGSDGGIMDGDDFSDIFDRYQGTIVHEFSNYYQDTSDGGGSGWEFNNDQYQQSVITMISSGYAHASYPGAYAVAHGDSADTGSNHMSAFGPNSSPDSGPGDRHGTGNSAFYYKTWRDAMSWDVTGSTNRIRVGSGGVATESTNTNVISYRNISRFEFQPLHGMDMDSGYQRFSGRMKRWIYYDKLMTQNQLVNLTDDR